MTCAGHPSTLKVIAQARQAQQRLHHTDCTETLFGVHAHLKIRDSHGPPKIVLGEVAPPRTNFELQHREHILLVPPVLIFGETRRNRCAAAPRIFSNHRFSNEPLFMLKIGKRFERQSGNRPNSQDGSIVGLFPQTQKILLPTQLTTSTLHPFSGLAPLSDSSLENVKIRC